MEKEENVLILEVETEEGEPIEVICTV